MTQIVVWWNALRQSLLSHLLQLQYHAQHLVHVIVHLQMIHFTLQYIRIFSNFYIKRRVSLFDSVAYPVRTKKVVQFERVTIKIPKVHFLITFGLIATATFHLKI